MVIGRMAGFRRYVAAFINRDAQPPSASARLIFPGSEDAYYNYADFTSIYRDNTSLRQRREFIIDVNMNFTSAY